VADRVVQHAERESVQSAESCEKKAVIYQDGGPSLNKDLGPVEPNRAVSPVISVILMVAIAVIYWSPEELIILYVTVRNVFITVVDPVMPPEGFKTITVSDDVFELLTEVMATYDCESVSDAVETASIVALERDEGELAQILADQLQQ
jgi:flagellin-like protein